jgi:hypothetical protein
MRGVRIAASLSVVIGATVVRAQNTRCDVFPPGGSVGVFADSLAQNGTILLTSPTPGIWTGSFHIIAILSGAVADGMTSAQFRVHLPLAPTSGLFLVTTPNPSVSLWIGDPLALGSDDGGVIAAFPVCQHGQLAPGGTTIVPIAHVTAASLVPFDTPVLVQKRQPPDVRAPCPIFSRCNADFSPAPMFIEGVDESGEAFTFRGRLFCKDTPVGVSPATWTAIRTLYR